MEVLELILLILATVLFPGVVFCTYYALFLEWVDRKFFARLQNRVGPWITGPKGILQPIADIIKLLAKEDITPNGVDRAGFVGAPFFALTLALFSLMFVPIASTSGILSFKGDLLIVLFISTVFGIIIIFAGYVSASRFSIVGTARAGLQFVGYEIPLFVSAIIPALIARSLTLKEIVEWQIAHYPLILCFPAMIAFGIFIVCSLAKLEKLPFDIPEAETEIVAGWATEFSGKKLALFRLSTDLKMLLLAGLATALFLGGPAPWGFTLPADLNPYLAALIYSIWFVIKTIIVVLIMSTLKAAFARYRIDQALRGFWRYLTPLSLAILILTPIVAYHFYW
ncbi:MAG: complex I subunit 1/NuoH family protein [Candidatus Baldrarchaeia archaeon]